MAFGDKVENQMVVNIQEHDAGCAMCDGIGKTEMNKKDFWKWFGRKIIHEKLRTAEILRIRKEYKQSGKVDCEMCGGSGSFKVVV